MVARIVLLLTALALASCATGRATGRAPTDRTDDAVLEDATRRYLALVQELSPETATSLGLHARDAELDDRTPEGFARGIAREEQMLADLKSRFAHAALSRAAQTDLALLESALAVDIRTKRDRNPLERQPDWFIALNSVFQITAREHAPASVRAKSALARIEKMPAQLLVAERTVKSPPKIWTQVAIESARGAASFLDEQRAFIDAALPGEKAHVATIMADAKRAFARYADFLEREVLPRSTGDFAAGRELFEWLLRESYFLDARADDLDALGRKLIADTTAEIERVARRIDPNAPWPEVVVRAKTHHGKAAGLLDDYRREVQRARRFLADKDIVPFPPGDDCQVIETPGFLRTIISAAYDAPPPFDAGTRGFFFVTPVDPSLPAEKQEEALRENDHGDMVDTAVHEAYPGHHLQLSFARRHPSLMRRVSGASIFAEGWGLYSEELMAELGYYDDEERLMQLDWALVRAVRVVVDVGLHTKGMTFEQAVAMLTDVAHVGPDLAAGEVKRYTLEPTQPLSYMVGREMIFRLRERYREAAQKSGARFSLKRFHADLLSHGTIPPGLIEREMF